MLVIVFRCWFPPPGSWFKILVCIDYLDTAEEQGNVVKDRLQRLAETARGVPQKVLEVVRVVTKRSVGVNRSVDREVNRGSVGNGGESSDSSDSRELHC